MIENNNGSLSFTIPFQSHTKNTNRKRNKYKCDAEKKKKEKAKHWKKEKKNGTRNHKKMIECS